MFDDILEAICHGASGSGVGIMLDVSRSTVCEAWQVRGKELSDGFRGRDLSGIDVVVALAIDAEGYKHLLDFEEGASECEEVVKGLFARLKERGLQAGVVRRLRGVQGREAGEEAFMELLDFIRGKNLAAAECLEKRRGGILAFHGLEVPLTLNVTFLSTNNIENVMRNTRGTIGRVCRWNPKTDQLSRWMGVALLRAQEGFRRIHGHKEMGKLATALGGLAGGSGFSYHMSISQPAEILTI
jgi:hypothetical protein